MEPARVVIVVPAALRQHAGGASRVRVVAGTLGDALAALGALAPRVLDDQGQVRRHVHVFVNQAAVADITMALADGDVIHILPAVSGGAAS